MQKVILGNKIIVSLSNNVTLEKECTDVELALLKSANTEEEVVDILCPELKKNRKETIKLTEYINKVKSSGLISYRNNAFYWDEVSSLSLPKDLVQNILTAKFNGDSLKLETYKNFWTLLSLNTDTSCRNNLYRFLQLHGLVIAKCGFFVAYRNVDKTADPNIYTDNYTHSFKIKIGEMVVMDRKQVNSDSNIECSRGLHCAGKNWLERNYYGSVGLACLVNPADVCAVPKNSSYGKLRTCAYLPIETIEFNSKGHVIPLDVETGFDCSYVSKVIYEGIMGTEEDSPYKILIPDTELHKESIQDNLLEIAKKCITDRWI